MKSAEGGAYGQVKNGVAVLSYPAGNLQFEQAFGKRRSDGDQPMTVESQFAVASVTKPMTSVLILQLLEQGKLGPDGLRTTLEETGLFDDAILDRLLLVDGKNYGRQITIHQLLGHRSGMRDVFTDDGSKVSEAGGMVSDANSFSNQVMSGLEEHVVCRKTPGCRLEDLKTGKSWVPWDPSRPDDKWAGVLNFYLNNDNMAASGLFRPGEGYHYSDTGYIILGLLVEKLTGRSLAEAYRRHIFEPLGMTRSYLQYREDSDPDAPWMGDLADSYIGGFPIFSQGLNISFDWAGGGVVSTAGDLVKFIRGLGEGRLFRDAATLGIMTDWSFYPRPDGAKVGRGYDLSAMYLPDGRELWGHTGFWGAIMLYEPATGLAFAGTLNAAGAVVHQWAKDMIKAVPVSRD